MFQNVPQMSSGAAPVELESKLLSKKVCLFYIYGIYILAFKLNADASKTLSTDSARQPLVQFVSL